MNGIVKCIAVVLVITFGLNACGGESSGESSGTMTNTDTSGLSAAAVRGIAIYEGSNGCSGCHGRDGEGTALAPSPINTSNPAVCATCGSVAQLTMYNEASMPLGAPGNCVGTCAGDVSAYIFEKFVQGGGGSNPPPNTPAILVLPNSGLVTTEGGIQTFTVGLNSEPADDVTINLVSSNNAEGTVSPTSHTFTVADWQNILTVTVTGVDDQVLDPLEDTPYQIQITAMSNDPVYAAIDPDDVSLANRDNEVAGQGNVVVNPTSGLVTTEDAGTAQFTVVLDSAPSADVTVGISSNNPAEGTVAPMSVTFNSVNFADAQTITVTGVDDAAAPSVDGPINYSIVTAAATSTDRAFAGVDPSDVMVTNNDNDVVPDITQFTTSAAQVAFAGSVTLTWASDADACTAGGANAGGQWAGALAASGNVTLNNLTTAGVNTFSISCVKGGIPSDPADPESSVNVTVEAQAGAPVVTLNAVPQMNVAYNGATTLTWNATDAASCLASGAWTGARGLTGTEQISGLTAASNVFTLACTGLGGTTTVSTTVTVVQPNPTISLVANPTTIGEGQSTTLTWTTTDMAVCSAAAAPANAQWSGAVGFNGSLAINNIQTGTSFALACMGTDGQNYSANAAVAIDPTTTGMYLYQTEQFGGGLTCAESFCHGPSGNMATLLNDKDTLCLNNVSTAGVVDKIAVTMPLSAGNALCGTECATKIVNYMFLNFYNGNTTDCEGNALPLALP